MVTRHRKKKDSQGSNNTPMLPMTRIIPRAKRGPRLRGGWAGNRGAVWGSEDLAHKAVAEVMEMAIEEVIFAFILVYKEATCLFSSGVIFPPVKTILPKVADNKRLSL